MKATKGLEVALLIGNQVEISTACPYYRTFPVKRGKLLEVLRDSVGKLYKVELDSGHEVYFRRAEIEPLYPEVGVSLSTLNGNGNKSHLSLT